MPAASLDRRLGALDQSLFAAIAFPGHRGDPASLLALHGACREAHGDFAYLEIGSHLGASLQPFVADPRCRAIVSIDPRPESQPDAREGQVLYPGNSTERMLEHLRRVPGADLSKLRTLEASTEDLGTADVGLRPQLCFVDGEHTESAALRDARFCRAALEGQGTVVFHDRCIVGAAIARFVGELARDGCEFRAYTLPSELFVVELGPPWLVRQAAVRSRRSPFARLLWGLTVRGPWRVAAVRLALAGETALRRLLPAPIKARVARRIAHRHAPAAR